MTRDEAAIETAKRWGFVFNPATQKWKARAFNACYADSPRWGRYACEDLGIAVQDLPQSFSA